jgi:hypothetical protein
VLRVGREDEEAAGIKKAAETKLEAQLEETGI